MWILIVATEQTNVGKNETFLSRIMTIIHEMTYPIGKMVICIQENHQDFMRQELNRTKYRIPYEWIIQERSQKDAGHALQCLVTLYDDYLPNSVMVLNGDNMLPYVSATSLDSFLFHLPSNLHMAIVGAILEDKTGFSRIYCDADENRIYVMEEKDCTWQQKRSLNLCNLGVYWFSIPFIQRNLSHSSSFSVTQLLECTPLSRMFIATIPVSYTTDCPIINKIPKYKID